LIAKHTENLSIKLELESSSDDSKVDVGLPKELLQVMMNRIDEEEVREENGFLKV
jgi:hypothetical protein